MKKILSLLILTLTLCGCTPEVIETLKPFIKAPEIKEIHLSAFSPSQKRITFSVSLYNPNSFTLPISGLNGDIKLNNLLIGSLNANSSKNLAALSTQEILVPILLDKDAFIKAVKSVLYKRTAQYNFIGHIKSSAGEIPFTKQGNLSVKDIISAFF